MKETEPVKPSLMSAPNDQQRDALSKIVYGKETVPGGTVLQVFNSTMSTVLDPIFKPIEFSVNIEERTARLVVPGIIESTIDPIRNPITGNKHRARINLPNGFEYTEAEIASGKTKATGAVKLDLENTHSHLAVLHLTQNGVVR